MKGWVNTKSVYSQKSKNVHMKLFIESLTYLYKLTNHFDYFEI